MGSYLYNSQWKACRILMYQNFDMPACVGSRVFHAALLHHNNAPVECAFCSLKILNAFCTSKSF